MQAFGVVLLPKATLVLVFVVMAAVLAVRPHGLLGRAQALTRGEADTWALIRPAGPALRALGVGVLALAVVAPFFAGPFVLSVLTEALVAMLFAASFTP